jgi:hypothetical protein
MQRINLSKRNISYRLIPGLIQFILVDRGPSLDKFKLFNRQTPGEKLSVHTDRSLIFSEEYLKMRLVVLSVICVQHFDYDVIKPAKLRHTSSSVCCQYYYTSY